MDDRDPTLHNLLELAGSTMVFDDGHWVKFAAERVSPTPQTPQGIRYALTLHDASGKRVLGYDNAHSIKVGRGPGAKTSKTADHKHVGNRKLPFPYTNAGDLLDAFWRDVDRYLKKRS